MELVFCLNAVDFKFLWSGVAMIHFLDFDKAIKGVRKILIVDIKGGMLFCFNAVGLKFYLILCGYDRQA